MSAMSRHHLELTERAQSVAGRPAFLSVDGRELTICLGCGAAYPLADWCPRCDGTEEGWDDLERRVG